MDMPSHISLAELSQTKKRELLAELLQKEMSAPQSFPLSFAQQGLWFLHQLAPDSPLYNIACSITIKGPLQKKLLERSLSELIHSHQALRTHFEMQEDHPIQLIEPIRPISLSVVDLAELPGTSREIEVRSLSRQE